VYLWAWFDLPFVDHLLECVVQLPFFALLHQLTLLAERTRVVLGLGRLAIRIAFHNEAEGAISRLAADETVVGGAYQPLAHVDQCEVCQLRRGSVGGEYARAQRVTACHRRAPEPWHHRFIFDFDAQILREAVRTKGCMTAGVDNDRLCLLVPFREAALTLRGPQRFTSIAAGGCR
jgi:hypothetical protein